MNRRQFLKTTTVITAATLGSALSPAVARAAEAGNRSIAPESTVDDRRAPLVDHETFTQVAELELRQATRLQYYVSVLVLWIDTGEADVSKRSSRYRSIAEAIRADIRSTDVLSVTRGEPSLQILLVGAYLDSLPSITERIVPAMKGHSVRVGGACFPTNARDRAELFDVAESCISDPRNRSSEVSRSLKRSAARRLRMASSLEIQAGRAR